MSVRYELWDVDAGNMIGAYATRAEALVEIRGLLEANGLAYADDLALGLRDGDGDASEPAIEGAALAQLAIGTSDQTRRSA